MRDLLSYCRGILVSLHAHGFPEAIVAGGAIRDLDNHREDTVKDIDVVIFDRPGYLHDLKTAMAGFQHRVAVAENVANYLDFENVACVHEFWEQDGLAPDSVILDPMPPVQVVVAKTKRNALEILQRHDFGLCQIGFDGSTILKTAAYVLDQANKTFTLVRCRDHKDYWRSVGRYQRLSQTKYAGWPMVNCSGFTK